MVIKNNKQEELPKKRWLDEKEKEGIVFLTRVKRGGGDTPMHTMEAVRVVEPKSTTCT